MKKFNGTPNLNGRPKGSLNKATATTREWVVALIQKNHAQVERDLRQLTPIDRLKIIEKLMTFALPRMTASSVTVNDLSDENLEILIEQTILKIEQNGD